jgi:hypothetical protein
VNVETIIFTKFINELEGREAGVGRHNQFGGVDENVRQVNGIDGIHRINRVYRYRGRGGRVCRGSVGCASGQTEEQDGGGKDKGQAFHVFSS